MKRDIQYRDCSSQTPNKITPLKAIEILAQEGVSISEDQATIILEFMYKMARIEVDQYLNDNSQKIEPL